MSQNKDIDVPVYRGQLTHDLGNALHAGVHGLDVIPKLLRRALELEAWKERVVIETGEIIEGFASFEEYVHATPPAGLGSSMPVIERLLKDDTQALVKIRKETKHQGARTDTNNFHYNIMEVKQGTSKAYLAERLGRERPELYEQVKSKQKSIHKASVEAGFIPRTIPVAIEDVDSIARTLRKHLDATQLDELVKRLTDN